MRNKQVVQEVGLKELTIKTPITPKIELEKLSRLLLTDAEFEACNLDKLVIMIKGRRIFTGGKQQFKAILDIADPECVNNGEVKLVTQKYFHWSAAKPVILRRFGLTDIGYSGAKSKVNGITISFESKSDEENRGKYINLLKVFLSKQHSLLGKREFEMDNPNCTLRIEYACPIEKKPLTEVSSQ